MDIINKYNIELIEDTKIDELNLKDVQMKLPAIKHKWVSRLILHKEEYNKLKHLQRAAKEKVINELKQNQNIILSLPVLEKRAEENDVIRKIKNQLEDQELIILYLDKIETVLRSMSFDIKNIIDIMKLEET